MAYVRMNTEQHRQGSIIEDFIFYLLKNQGKEVYGQEKKGGKFAIPIKIEKYINQDTLPFLESYPFDILLLENNKLKIIEVKSKGVKFSKEDRKIDISNKQYKVFSYLETIGINVRILVVWIFENKYYYKVYKFKNLKTIGKKKLKLKLPLDTKYSPRYVKYKKIPKELNVSEKLTK